MQFGCEEREHRVRVGEDHGAQIGQVRTQEVAPAYRVLEAGEDLAERAGAWDFGVIR